MVLKILILEVIIKFKLLLGLYSELNYFRSIANELPLYLLPGDPFANILRGYPDIQYSLITELPKVSNALWQIARGYLRIETF
jgi:hypothetical protein